jgi:DUF4097 and DUF4098 domain-containing protein YvlB
MKTRNVLACVTALLSLPALADTEVSRTVDAAADGNVEVSNIAGSTEIRGWSRNSVEVKATLGDDVEELIVERNGDSILIKVKVPRHHGRDIDADLDIRIPENSSVDVSGVSADIDVEGVFGEQSLATVSGDVRAIGVSDDVEAASVSGDIEIGGTGKQADVEAATVSGDVRLANIVGSLELESVSGDVTVTEGSFESVELETVNGDIEFVSELRDGGELGMESVNGSIEALFTKEVSGRFDIETFNGSIRNCFGPKPERTSKYSPGLELRFSQGDGESHVVIETLNGSIRICNQ